ncbi:hypothetical protein CYJ20_009515 [Winkia neuii]|nr:hypothetical protein [Winkia neuii]WIK90449.1 hypothetical protein CYJ20_009515 [Winkia neuii]
MFGVSGGVFGVSGGVFGVSGGVFGVSGSSIMVTFFCFAVALLLRVCSVTVPSASTEKVTGRAILYPVGAFTSISVYVPGVSPKERGV